MPSFDVVSKVDNHEITNAVDQANRELNSRFDQAYMLSTNDIFWVSGVLFLMLMILIWFARPPFIMKSHVAVE